MNVPHKVRRVSSITVRQFFDHDKDALKLKLIGSDAGMERKIAEPSTNRPGLVLAGFQRYFAYKRVQVMGNSELSYLESLPPAVRVERFASMCDTEIPCIVIARGRIVPEELVKAANAKGICVFQTSMVTMKFINLATLRLDWAFSPTTTMHGCMVDVQGIGLLITGKSGIGKSESVIGLLQRGASLVADDAVRLRLNEEREIIGTAPEITRSMIEVRGLGLLNVARLFGVGSVRLSKRLDLIIHLVADARPEDIERVGAEIAYEDVLGLPVARIDIPVEKGRDVAGLIAIAALHHKLRAFGYDSAGDFNQRLLKKMTDDQLG
jgi:HPr kinase/phosphorylase